MSQCKTKAELHREYARVCDMCEGTKLNPWDCVKINESFVASYPCFSADSHKYQFALAIIEGKPVFTGDLLYSKYDGLKYNAWIGICGNEKNWSWNPPHPKKLVINGIELPEIIAAQTLGNNVILAFEKKQDAHDFLDILEKELNEQC